MPACIDPVHTLLERKMQSEYFEHAITDSSTTVVIRMYGKKAQKLFIKMPAIKA
jgi:hypothetical protein